MTGHPPDTKPPPLRMVFTIVGWLVGLFASGCGIITLVAGIVFFPRSEPLGYTVMSMGLLLSGVALIGWLIWWIAVKWRR